MNRSLYINKINTYAARFVLEVESFNKSNLYDINIHAESFLIPILNEVFGLRLENLNSTQKKNFPAIDLADFKSRVAFQITATNDFDKIKATIQKFNENKLNNAFDVLYIYIITHKKEKYNDDKLTSLLPVDFRFSTTENVIDKDDLIQKITTLSSTPKIEAISKIYEHEFSDFQIQMREKTFINGCLNTDPEPIVPNLLKVSFPEYFFQAELNIDEEAITSDVNDYLISIDRKPVKKLKPNTLVKKALRANHVKTQEWILHEKYIYTFRDLGNPLEPFRKIIDVGTITQIECKDYYDNENTLRVFKNLLRNTLMEFCKLKGIEWFGEQDIFRFANNSAMPNQKQIRWKGKNEATKTVIFEMHNKKEGHIVCFRSLAFRSSFLNIEHDWYLVLNPTWSFTNPGGYKTSRFESAYMSGMKRLEANGSVYNYFRFFSYYLSLKDLFTTPYPFLEIQPIEKLSIVPKLEEKAWKPLKAIEGRANDIDIEIKIDNELTDNTLF
ncbi:MAG: hypothetical protein JWQ38_2041 [Flavipsychrobacter sp.]|nr:hypothetical protein [Flavipsychrobacter sp.]